MKADERQRLEDEALRLDVEERRARVVEREALAVAALLNTLLIPNSRMPLVLGIGTSTWQNLKKAGTVPPCVMVAGREFWIPAAVAKWISLQLQSTVPAAGDDDEEERHERASPPDYLHPGLDAAPR